MGCIGAGRTPVRCCVELEGHQEALANCWDSKGSKNSFIRSLTSRRLPLSTSGFTPGAVMGLSFDIRQLFPHCLSPGNCLRDFVGVLADPGEHNLSFIFPSLVDL